MVISNEKYVFMLKFFNFTGFWPLAFVVMFSYSLTISADIQGKKKTKENSQTEYKGEVGTTITLVTSGTGDTKEDATKNALRSALEQTYGAFVSSNTKVVNDELISDEIVSISTGNIAKYEILSVIDSSPIQVTTKAVVSISNLQSYAQNKGMSAELAGNTFAMNLKIEELNKENQNKAMKHLLEETKIMAEKLFDYELKLGNPEKTPKGVQIQVTIIIKANSNTVAYYDLFHKTLTSLAVHKKQGRDVHLYGAQGVKIKGMKQFDDNAIVYELRGEAGDHEPYNTIYTIFKVIGNAVLNCELVDNLGNVSGFKEESNYSGVTRDFITTNKLSSDYYGGSGRSTRLRGYRDGYETFPLMDGLANENGVYFWMNAVKPKVGEKLYDTNLFLIYSVDEISKINKIEIRPKQERTTGSNMSIMSTLEKIYKDYEEAEKYLDLYNKEENIEVAFGYLEKSYNLFKKIKDNPALKDEKIIKREVANDIDDYLNKIEPILKGYKEKQ